MGLHPGILRNELPISQRGSSVNCGTGHPDCLIGTGTKLLADRGQQILHPAHPREVIRAGAVLGELSDGVKSRSIFGIDAFGIQAGLQRRGGLPGGSPSNR
jgi:hypothetical protein